MKEKLLEMIKDALSNAYNQGIRDGHPCGGKAMSDPKLLEYVDYDEIEQAVEILNAQENGDTTT